MDVDTLEGGSSVTAALSQHDAIIVGAPTWNTGADTERSGTGWDALYYSGDLESSSGVLQGKKVAVFGLGDQISYTENYADATGELYDVFTSLGCDMVPYAMTSQEGYEHEDSKSIRGDKFCGLLLDEVNQEDLTDERVEAWVEQLKAGGFLEGASSSTSSSSPAPQAAVVAEAPVMEAAIQESLAEASVVLEETIAKHSTATDFVPHFNPVTKRTMWTSPDGRESFVTTASPPTSALRP